MARSGIILNRSRLADIMGVAEVTIDAWRKSGLPCQKDGRALQFNSKEVVDWLLERERAVVPQELNGIPIEQVRLRAETARMRMAELELATMEGDAVSIEDWREAHADIAVRIRTRLLALPASVAWEVSRAVITADVKQDIDAARAAVQQLLDDKIHEILTELSEGESPEGKRESDGDRFDDLEATGEMR